MSDLYQAHTIHFRKNKFKVLPGTWYGTTGGGGKMNEERTGSDLLYYRLATSVCKKVVQGSKIISCMDRVLFFILSKLFFVYFLPSK